MKNRGARGPQGFRLPRARMAVAFELHIGDGRDKRFSANLPSRDLSVTGAFLKSSYFLPVGTRLKVSFQVDEDLPPLRASAEIVRHEKAGPGGEGGFAIRFSEFEGDSRVLVTELILGERLHVFIDRYLRSKRSRQFHGEAEKMADLLASWELHKATAKR